MSAPGGDFCGMKVEYVGKGGTLSFMLRSHLEGAVWEIRVTLTA